MIFSLQGKVQELTPTYAVMNVGGVGYYVGISLMTSQNLVAGQDAMLYTQQIIREDANLLFGFITKSEKEMFNLLISVNGVGAVSALILLSTLSLSDIASAILSRNSAVIQKAKGLGAKTAERIIVDLKDKVAKFATEEENYSATVDNKVKDEALSALEVLGISRRMSEKLADRVMKENPAVSVEELVKQILKNM
ncbi:ATP-dependent DNA helicase RuvA [Chryseobacterium sp. Leaf180]|uniref:Holliday junction branch migration protein RuvA n=1 Tax=Chryseobacterium sp. Leaf180 TaxID=1736289 RepID=UPI0006FC8681|nr:Holliday junction branch migration protein RuvA [Chryseobacterium sp. Leaf180]KQR95617.1 ATP-dependent DNA helicase RuvA [Chryseobacterium sp. Leaf180]